MANQTNTASSVNPSIGSIGTMYHDERNNRVKYFSTKIHSSPKSIENEFNACVEMMQETGATRATMRAVANFPYVGDSVEAAIPLNNGFGNHRIIYLGQVSGARTNPQEVLDEEAAMLRKILETGIVRVRNNPDIEVIRITKDSATGANIRDMVELYNEAFTTYTSALDENAVRSMIENTVVYGAADETGRIISTSVAEIAAVPMESGKTLKLCELSEMATLRNYRGRGINSQVTEKLIEQIMPLVNVIYAESRACHAPINAIFASHNFECAGTLQKHCILSGDSNIREDGPYENLNVWHLKH